jgi:hypothetical protein
MSLSGSCVNLWVLEKLLKKKISVPLVVSALIV